MPSEHSCAPTIRPKHRWWGRPIGSGRATGMPYMLTGVSHNYNRGITGSVVRAADVQDNQEQPDKQDVGKLDGRVRGHAGPISAHSDSVPTAPGSHTFPSTRFSHSLPLWVTMTGPVPSSQSRL